jgi:hypothetical protein
LSEHITPETQGDIVRPGTPFVFCFSVIGANMNFFRAENAFTPRRMADVQELMRAHFSNFLYRTTARRWHALWCRWLPDGTLKECFRAERTFTPVTDDAIDMGVVYHYGDERGTVSEGPRCGPWRITEAEHSAADGLTHPSSADMTTLLLPARGPAAWCMKRSVVGQQPCAVELFLHHGEDLRMSVGAIHSAAGDLVQLSTIREDARKPFPSYPSDFWSDGTDAAASDSAGLAAALAEAGISVRSSAGRGHAIRANLVQREISSMGWESTRMAKVGASDVLLLCPDGVAIVSPRKRVADEPFSSAAAWWPKSDGSTITRILYTIEAHWDAQGQLADVVYVVFEQ